MRKGKPMTAAQATRAKVAAAQKAKKAGAMTARQATRGKKKY